MNTPNANPDALRWSRGTLERVPNCPACGSTDRTGDAFVSADHNTHMDADLWTFHRCERCRSLYLDPRPDRESLPRAYESYYTHEPASESPPTSGVAGVLWALIHGYLNRRFGMSRQPALPIGYPVFRLLPPFRLKLDFYGRHLYANQFPQRGRLLDVGCGNGAFLLRAKEMGWAASGLEPDLKAVRVARAQGLHVEHGDLSQYPGAWRGSFDVVTLSHVIEHVDRPLDDLRRALSLLRPGGMIWIVSPNSDSIGARFYRGCWRGLHAPCHLYIPSGTQLKNLLSNAGFVTITHLNRGAHAKMICRESAKTCRLQKEIVPRTKAFISPALRALIDLTATLFAKATEETVVVAYRPQ